jgi:hypothetical protein
MMRLTQPLNTINWRYAFGEIVLIAIGVLIALAAADWQSERAARNAEKTILTQIAASLTQDRDQVGRWCQMFRNKEARIEELIAQLQTQQPYTESLDPLFGSVYGFGGAWLNPAAYESLKSQGMDLISDSSLRYQISEVYEKTFPRIDYNQWLSRSTILELIRPYYLQNFREIQFHRSATPLDYEKILSDVVFRNLLDYRLQQIQAVHVPMCETARQEMEMLLQAITAYVE